uniref:NADH dehydrogenase subunit 2 n=1 Tax=Salganea incerta TaxID=112978 RepID=UPI00279DC94D|nr:NADH dehydrogenase subunit 2 [Salganea incerta]WGO57652.1 NADH dehydrogenase subunit 2 [Salganea incerta]
MLSNSNSTKILFMMILISSLLITISSNSWVGAWMGLEINLLSFIPLMSDNNDIFTTEAALKYFLVQALASSSLLFIILSKSILESMFSIINSSMTSIIIAVPLFMKMGAAPLHWWFPSVMEGLSWMNCFILMTVQSMPPLILISYSIHFNKFTVSIIILSILIGTIGGYNQISLRKILAYSSINHLGWMITAMIMSENSWFLYFMIYTLLTFSVIYIVMSIQMSFINQTYSTSNENKVIKLMMYSSLLSLGGLPPFLGFFPKWVVIQQMIINSSPMIITIMVILSLTTLYYYLRIAYSSMIILNSENNWTPIMIEVNEFNIPAFLLTLFSTTGLIISSFFLNIVF